jgi:tetratricopeptide (TPR) repeat protein
VSWRSKRVLLACLVLIAATVIVYAPVRHFGFVLWDDQVFVTDNVHVVPGLTWQGVRWALTTGATANWHPLTWLSHMLDVQLYGMNPGPHHVTNLLLHVLNSLLLFGVLYYMTAAWGRSFCVAALFAVHPLHVESVAWIAERKDVLSTLFWMLTMWAYVAYVRRPGRKRYVLVVALFGLGLMAKPMLVTLPFALLLLDFWPLKRIELAEARGGRLAAFREQGAGPRQLVKEKLPLFVLAAMSSVVTVLVQKHAGALAGLASEPLSLRLTNAAAAYLAYTGKMLWPVRLAAFYPLGKSIPVLQASLGCLLLVDMTLLAIRIRLRCPYVLVGWLWYVGTLIPVIGLVQVGEQSMADRYTYVPLIGLSLIAAWGATELATGWRYGRRALPVVAGCVTLACAATARAQVRYWNGDVALWRHTLNVTTDNCRAHFYLGSALLAQGKLDEAIQHFSEALRLKPQFVEAWNQLGLTLMKQGKPDEAAPYLAEALRLKPQFVEAWNNLGLALMMQGKLDEAVPRFAEALRLRPDNATAHKNLGALLLRQGRLDEATRHLAEAVRLRPNDAEAHYDLGVALMLQEKFDEAVQQFTAALRIRPDLVEAANNLKLALAKQAKKGP